ncbi:MAG: energy transducer TonB, partial [Phycisphaerales bacterium]
MKIGLFFGITCAVVLHVGVILFGGLAFVGHRNDYGTLQQVELVSEDDAVSEKDKAKDKSKEEPKEPEAQEKDAVETEAEQPPDAEELVRNLELSAAANAPALEAASLGAIEAALAGQASGGGDFGDVVTFASGGVIGGKGAPGALTDNAQREFDLTEIDQKPRPIIQEAPVYPASMRGEKGGGVVTVLFVVDASGAVGNVRVEKSSHQAFERPALDAVRRWKFEPAVRGGQRVPCKMRVPIRFQ